MDMLSWKKQSAENSRDNDLDYKPSQIVVSTGAKQSLYNIAQVMLNDGDE
jgi:aspartate aminotransferase